MSKDEIVITPPSPLAPPPQCDSTITIRGEVFRCLHQKEQTHYDGHSWTANGTPSSGKMAIKWWADVEVSS